MGLRNAPIIEEETTDLIDRDNIAGLSYNDWEAMLDAVLMACCHCTILDMLQGGPEGMCKITKDELDRMIDICEIRNFAEKSLYKAAGFSIAST